MKKMGKALLIILAVVMRDVTPLTRLSGGSIWVWVQKESWVLVWLMLLVSFQDSTRNPISINKERIPTLRPTLTVRISQPNLITTLTRLLTPLVRMRLRRTDSQGMNTEEQQLTATNSHINRMKISINTNRPVLWWHRWWKMKRRRPLRLVSIEKSSQKQ